MFTRVITLVNWSDKNKFMRSYPKRHMVIWNGRLLELTLLKERELSKSPDLKRTPLNEDPIKG